MLEIHSMGSGDPRLRPQNQIQNHNYNYNQLQPLKCPRCDSLNTKFCYYNNYNLSQPRHFCKNCRRYWTKGGVLRNVPVGGGCRKSKRSTTPKTTTNNPSSSSDTAPAIAPTTPPPAPPSHPTEPERNSNSHSSSESFSLTVAATEAVSAPTSNSVSNNNVRESKLFSLEQGHHSGIFSDIGTFTSLIASNNEPLGFGFGTNSNNNNNNSNNNNILDATSFRFGVTHDQVQGGGQGQWQQQSNQDFGTASFFDHTVPVEFSSSLLQHKSAGRSGGFGSLDWQQGADQGLFDLSNTVDQPYWSHTHWSDQDNQTLFHLP